MNFDFLGVSHLQMWKILKISTLLAEEMVKMAQIDFT